MKLLVDSSAFAKRYVQEDGSELAVVWLLHFSSVIFASAAAPSDIYTLFRLHGISCF